MKSKLPDVPLPTVDDKYIKGTTTPYSTPGNLLVVGRIVGTDPKPPKHPRVGKMYYVVKLEGNLNYVFILSDIDTGE